MAQFRGIGDTATQVKMQQDEMALRAAQISENARQANMQQASQAAGRAQQARQFNQSLGEQGRQFDASQAAGEGREAWRQGFAEKQAGVSNAADERRTRAAEYGAQLQAYTTAAELQNKDIDTRMKTAQLGAYVAATLEEQRKLKSREEDAIAVFAALGQTAAMNGGTIPVSAGNLAAQELGLKGGGIRGQIDLDGTGNTHYEIPDDNGQIIQKSISPDRMYSAIELRSGKAAADFWAKNLEHNMQATAMIQRARIQAEAKAAVNPAQKVQAANYLVKDVENQLKAFDAANPGLIAPGAKAKPEQVEAYNTLKAERDAIAKQADPARAFLKTMFGGESPAAGIAVPAPAEITPEVLEANGIPWNAKVTVDPQTGKRMAVWRGGGAMNTREINEGGEAAPAKSAPAAASGGFGTMGGSGTPLPAPAAKAAPAQAAPATAASPFATSFTAPGMDQVEAEADDLGDFDDTSLELVISQLSGNDTAEGRVAQKLAEDELRRRKAR